MITPGQIYYCFSGLSFIFSSAGFRERMQKLTVTESPSVPTVVVSVEKAYQQLYCKKGSMVYFMKEGSKELPIPFRLAARKLYLLQ